VSPIRSEYAVTYRSKRTSENLFCDDLRLVASGDFVTGAATVTMSLVLDTTGGSGNWHYGWIVNGTVVTNRALSASFESAIGGVGIAKHGSISPHAFKAFSLVRQ